METFFLRKGETECETGKAGLWYLLQSGLAYENVPPSGDGKKRINSAQGPMDENSSALSFSWYISRTQASSPKPVKEHRTV